MSDIWNTIADERGALATDLADLTPAQWDAPSLCPGWTVRDLVAHLSATASLNPATFFAAMAKARFNFDRFANGQIAKHLGPDPVATLTGFRRLQHSTSAPPGPTASWLGEVVIHGADIRRPLGIPHAYDLDTVRQVIDFYKGSNMLIGAKKRIAGLSLSATDDDWRHGEGDTVEGPLLSLLLAMTGRRSACDDLSGPGAAALQSRCGSAR
ncbi:maleylpyruvate isomerase family mycothiol-dependent enzyme [Mycobacterium sp. Aquia_213]|uniref:maleylpyruvate isomerase family mycothiol-dependent enzyme n=1 Tax=Mycobacterium sp. Aquia_213 TaxID=2991728 RepID=UPI0022700EDF|nr:maleylpyruvate isomerase family mycothiol-dependent enzyme [Mycobacterium sp. Aquia_213]WAC90911.1 maleylpyruvate isomerase family mycothiol-dependent enzyme [Mycobacterium sp. Aquia_213]